MYTGYLRNSRNSLFCSLEVIVAKVCIVTGKRPISGNRVSHANNKTKRRFLPNLQSKRLWSPELGRFVRLKISAKGLKTINKRGVDRVLGELKAQGVKF